MPVKMLHIVRKQDYFTGVGATVLTKVRIVSMVYLTSNSTNMPQLFRTFAVRNCNKIPL